MTLLRNNFRHSRFRSVVTGFLVAVLAYPLYADTVETYRDRISGDEACRAGDFPSGASFYHNYRKLAEKNMDAASVRDAYEREIDALIRAGLGDRAESVLNGYVKVCSKEVDSTSVALWRTNIRILQNRIPEADIDFVEKRQAMPPSLAGECAADPFYVAKGGVHFRRASANALLTIFEGGHDSNFPAGFEFLSRQRKGAKADFSIPDRADGTSAELTK